MSTTKWTSEQWDAWRKDLAERIRNGEPTCSQEFTRGWTEEQHAVAVQVSRDVYLRDTPLTPDLVFGLGDLAFATREILSYFGFERDDEADEEEGDEDFEEVLELLKARALTIN